jgi:niacin transporter
MNNNNKVKTMTIAALLSAIGIIIPMFSPIKLVIEPASFTFASHVPIFIAMFISPVVAIFAWKRIPV